MKLQQLRYIQEVARRGLNISAAAESLHTSQPGVSKQIRLLEDELGVEIFARSGKHLSQITPVGQAILNESADILERVGRIKALAKEVASPSRGELGIATTHTQARYVLPPVIRAFMKRYPGVRLHMHQGNPDQVAAMAVNGEAEFAIATESIAGNADLVMLPCYRWNRSVLVPKGHPLTKSGTLTLEAISKFPVVTYVSGFTGREQLDKTFADAGLSIQIVFTAADSDVIKTYVRLGTGIGIVAHMALEARSDHDLVALDARHLFPPSVTWIGIRKGMFLRRYMYHFIEAFCPHLDRTTVDEILQTTDGTARQARIDALVLPER
jgi:LysR family cys regulon transcriptional activator